MPSTPKRTRRKVAISVSADVLAAADRLSRETGESRSAVYERAIRAYLASREHAEQSRRYVDGYRRSPESARELSTVLAASLPSFAAEPWDEAR